MNFHDSGEHILDPRCERKHTIVGRPEFSEHDFRNTTIFIAQCVRLFSNAIIPRRSANSSLRPSGIGLHYESKSQFLPTTFMLLKKPYFTMPHFALDCCFHKLTVKVFVQETSAFLVLATTRPWLPHAVFFEAVSFHPMS